VTGSDLEIMSGKLFVQIILIVERRIKTAREDGRDNTICIGDVASSPKPTCIDGLRELGS
jgi:hypothetical protein